MFIKERIHDGAATFENATYVVRSRKWAFPVISPAGLHGRSDPRPVPVRDGGIQA